MKAAVVGSGAWGTALAIRLCKNNHDVTMWTFEKDRIPQMEATRRNHRLPSAVLPEGLKISSDYAWVSGCKLVVMASPSFPARSVGKAVAPYIDEDAVVVSVTKGLENGTHLRMSQVVAETTGKEVVALTGPSHAEEVAIEVPTALPGVDSGILDPRDTYADAAIWEEKAKDLAARFQKNFVKYTGNDEGKALVAAGPQL